MLLSLEEAIFRYFQGPKTTFLRQRYKGQAGVLYASGEIYSASVLNFRRSP